MVATKFPRTNFSAMHAEIHSIAMYTRIPTLKYTLVHCGQARMLVKYVLLNLQRYHMLTPPLVVIATCHYLLDQADFRQLVSLHLA